MNVAYIISLDMPDGMSPDDIQGAALDIEDELAASGFDVISVAPWARPSLGLTPTGEGEEPPSLF